MNEITPMDIAPGRVRMALWAFNVFKLCADELNDDDFIYMERLIKRMEDIKPHEQN